MRDLTLTPVSRYVIAGAILTACSSDHDQLQPKASYDAPFPKDVAINLPLFIGDQVTTAKGGDTNVYEVAYNNINHHSYIMNDVCDTLFDGCAHKMEGLLYLNQQLDDTSWWYNGFKVTDQGLVGFMETKAQRLAMDREIESVLETAELAVHSNSYRIEPDKKAIHEFYTKNIAESKPQVIVAQHFPEKETLPVIAVKEKKKPATQEALYIKRTAKLVSRIGTNPETSAFRLMFNKKAKYDVQVYNSLGKTVHHTVADGFNVDLDFSYLPEGNYLILVVDPRTNEQDTRKLVVASI